MKSGHKLILNGIILTSATLSLNGCSKGVLIGAEPSDPPPAIAFLGARDAQGNDYLTWRNVSSFGPVPAELQQIGDEACKAVNTSLRASGYHPEAKDRKGNTIPGGGYFCQPSLISTNTTDD